MSKIIKGGRVRFFCFDYQRLNRNEEDESFNPLGALLPPEAQETLKEDQTQEESAPPPEPEEPESENQEELLEREEPAPEPEGRLCLADIPLEELLQHPEISSKLAHLEQEAYEKGFQQGQKDGEALGRKKYETLAARLGEVLKSLEKEIEDHVLALEPQLFSLVKTAVETILNHEVSVSPKTLETSLREALLHVVDQARVKIHLNPADLEFLEDILAHLREELSRLKDFEIVSDANLSRGGCLLETDFGLIDATIERKWKEFLKKLER